MTRRSKSHRRKRVSRKRVSPLRAQRSALSRKRVSRKRVSRKRVSRKMKRKRHISYSVNTDPKAEEWQNLDDSVNTDRYEAMIAEEWQNLENLVKDYKKLHEKNKELNAIWKCRPLQRGPSNKR